MQWTSEQGGAPETYHEREKLIYGISTLGQSTAGEYYNAKQQKIFDSNVY